MTNGLRKSRPATIPAIMLTLLMLVVLLTGFSTPTELADENPASFAAGQESLLWGETVSGSASTDSIEAIDLDAYGNTYVCGYFYNNAQFGNIQLNGQGSTDGFVGKISPSGNWLWAQEMGGTSSDQCKDIDVDDGGNISITGYFYSTATFGNTYLSSQGSYDVFVAKLDTNGTWLWAVRAGGSSDDQGHGVAMDNSGNVYITGYYYNTGYFGQFTLASYSNQEAFIAALAPGGQFIWAQRMYGSYYQRGRGIDVNDIGEVAVTGEFTYRINIGGTELSPGYQSSSYYRVFTAKFTTSGNFLWAKWAGYESSYSAHGEDVAIDNNGEVYTVGRFNYRMKFDGTWIYAYQQSNNWDCFVSKYNAYGAIQMAQSVGGSSTDYCYALDIGGTQNNITIAGMYQSTAWFGNTYIANSGSTDAFFATLVPSQQNPQTYVWDTIHHFGGSSSEYGYAVAVHNGTYAFGGYFHSSARDDANTLTLNSIGGADGFIITYGVDSDGDGVGDGTDAFPNDSSQWGDRDGDGFGDNQTGWQGDDCPDIFGNSSGGAGFFGCIDTDGDGWPDTEDHLPNDGTQWEDTDGDGFGNNPNGTDPDGCPMMWGNSWRDQFGCLDLDGDGQSVMNDRFPSQPTQWNDTDGDGKGDNWADGSWNVTRLSHWPGEWTPGAYAPDPNPLDWDDDGIEDEGDFNSTQPWDDCPFDPGDSYRNFIGCPDADGDGWADHEDAVPNNPSQKDDQDFDGYGDNPNGTEPDACPTRAGSSTIDRFGCPDNDGDGVSNDNDDCPTVAGIPSNGCPDRDGDGYVDEVEESNEHVDDCPDEAGTSYEDKFGCPDSDGDGWSDEGDPFPADASQWSDQDDDGYGDNPDGTNADDCPARWGNSTQGALLGCEDWDGDGYSDTVDPFPQHGLLWSDLDVDGFADQPGANISDDCPSEAGNSTLFKRGCPDMDGDTIPDFLDWDIDGDGYSNSDEVRSDPQSNPYDPLDTPQDSDMDGRADDVVDGELANSAMLSDKYGQLISAVVLILVIFSLAMVGIMLTSNSSRRKLFESMESELMESEGFSGLAKLEEELDEALRSGTIAGSQGMLLRHRIEERREDLEEEMRISQQAEWWAQMGQQQQQYGGWTEEQTQQWYAQQGQQGQGYDQYGGQQ